MPQLNPEPWLTILLISWVVFLTIVPTKVLAHTFPNQAGAVDQLKIKANPWNWPWH